MHNGRKHGDVSCVISLGPAMNRENQNTEYKRIWKDEYLKWVSGFANAQGGKIYIGIDDDMTVVGVDNLKKQLEDIPNKIISNTGYFRKPTIL